MGSSPIGLLTFFSLLYLRNNVSQNWPLYDLLHYCGCDQHTSTKKMENPVLALWIDPSPKSKRKKIKKKGKHVILILPYMTFVEHVKHGNKR